MEGLRVELFAVFLFLFLSWRDLKSAIALSNALEWAQFRCSFIDLETVGSTRGPCEMVTRQWG
jgi:hypothetical protein